MSPTQREISDARQLFVKEVEALCAAGKNPDGTPNDTLAPELLAAYTLLANWSPSGVWNLYDDKGRLSARLQYLYARRHVFSVLVGAVGLDVTYGEAGVTESLSDEAKNFLLSYKNAHDEITLLETQVRANVGVAVGQMVTTQPERPCAPWQPNPASGYYRGDPLRRGPSDRW